MVATVGRVTSRGGPNGGHRYYLNSVAKGRHDYYTGAGEAPGVWNGRGRGLLGLEGIVDPEVMDTLYGRFVDPRTAGGQRAADGRMMPETVLGRRVSPRTRPDGTVSEPLEALDVTFSPSKSVSVLWATASDRHVRDAVLRAHEVAVQAGLDYLEDNAGHSRAGVAGVRRVAGEGLIIAQFRHRSARSTRPGERVGDPQLHSHCAVFNRVKCVDGRWRTLDSQAVYRHAHAAGAFYGAVLERELTERLGVRWQAPEEGKRLQMRDIDGVPAEVIAAMSSRRADIMDEYEQRLAEWHDEFGRTPTKAESSKMLDEATLKSRQRKAHGGGDLHQQWRAQLDPADQAAVDAVTGQLNPSDGGRYEAGSVQLLAAVADVLHGQRATWSRPHVFAEISRLIDTPTREAIEVDTERFIAGCINLEPDEDETYAQWDATRYTSYEILAAEARVLDAAAKPSRWSIPTVVVDGLTLGDDQAEAVAALTSGGCEVVSVIGPAGAGKTTMLTAVAAAYEAAGRPIAVLALAAVAARVVTEETGVAASTIASWRVGNVRLPRDGLVVIDEASMVPTLTLDQIIKVAGVHRCRVALIGDYAQMSSPEAGGLLRDLACLPSATQMVAVRRFREQWERATSIRLRAKDPDVTATYLEHGRISPVTADDAVDTAAAAWILDTLAGKDALIVADTNAIAADVSARCQALLAVNGRLGVRVGTDADDNAIYVGDRIQTRENTNVLVTNDGERVSNRDVWRVTGRNRDGSITAAHARRPTQVTITQDYLEAHVQLAYCVTSSGAQGRTTDIGAIIVTPRTSAQSLYVGMTRGRSGNRAFVVTNGHDHDEFNLGNLSAEAAFAAAVVRGDGEQSAHATITQWKATAPAREQSRDADRRRDAALTWWTQRQQQLPDLVRYGLRHHHQLVVDDLTRRTPADWSRAVSAAIGHTDWRDRRSGERFIEHLARLAPRTTTSSDAGNTTARTFER